MTKPAHSPAQSTDPLTAAGLLKPELKKVLGNLNVYLEDELTRYRRQRRGQTPLPPSRIKVSRLSQKQLDLISVPAKAMSAAAGAPATTPPPLPPPPPPNPFLQQVPEKTDRESPAEDQTSAEAISAASAAYPEAEVQELVIHQDSAAPDSYLASSEELLKSLADEQADELPPTPPAQPYRPSRQNQLLAPLKVGLLLLLLVSGVGVGYAIVNPAVLSPILSRIRPSTAVGDTAETESAVSVDEQGNPEFSPLGPDLSTREFVELDLKSLSTLDVDTQAPSNPTASTPVTGLPGTGTTLPAPNGTAQPPAPTSGPASLTPIPTQSPTASSSQSPTASSGTASPPTAAPTPASTPKPSTAAPVAGSNYYVITDYTGDASLTKAREVVGDAFVRNYREGSRIQLGAFDNSTSAQQLIQELQAQGLTGRLYGPTDE